MLTPVPVNVGVSGGDLAARWFTLAATSLLTVSALPPLEVDESTLKIMALVAALSGTLFLMAGLVFLQNTHCAGLILIPGPFLIAGFRETGHGWMAAIAGAMVVSSVALSLVTRRCRINDALGIDSR